MLLIIQDEKIPMVQLRKKEGESLGVFLYIGYFYLNFCQNLTNSKFLGRYGSWLQQITFW